MLLARYWMRFDGWDESKSLAYNLVTATRPESITRRRRELFNKGLIKYSDKREKEVYDAYKNEKFGIDHTSEIDCE